MHHPCHAGFILDYHLQERQSPVPIPATLTRAYTHEWFFSPLFLYHFISVSWRNFSPQLLFQAFFPQWDKNSKQRRKLQEWEQDLFNMREWIYIQTWEQAIPKGKKHPLERIKERRLHTRREQAREGHRRETPRWSPFMWWRRFHLQVPTE